MTTRADVIDTVVSRSQTLTALSKSADPAIAKSAAASLSGLARLEKDLRDQEKHQAEFDALKVLRDQTTDPIARRALGEAMVSHTEKLYQTIIARNGRRG